MAYTYSKIATYTVGSGGVASIDFIAIPQNYTDLVILVSLRSTRATFANSSARVYFNNSTSGFSTRDLLGNGSTTASSSYSDAPLIYIPASGATASTFGNAYVYIPNYTGSNNKSYSVDYVAETNATTIDAQGFDAALWSNISAITSIKMTEANGQSFAQYSTAHLYGIKAEL